MLVLGSPAVVERSKQPARALGETSAQFVVRIDVVDRPAATVQEQGDRQGAVLGSVQADPQRPAHDQDWLIVCGDVGEVMSDIEWGLSLLARSFEKVVWVPGNHELWTTPADPVQLRGDARYCYLVRRCQDLGIATPEDPYPV